ncbi:hypothetical protein [Streptomyces beihaiensis]|uniref:Transmembrane protein n=1 Tax=Streptomyces beihaiensis TaxID=2984495 RepID=A0ABT3TNE3_9ACTN|nr:hypothetical protein [Streptomyces beihaiensis]MCX3058536.1 hypothetical protein [Streptomyces beihaiensis]
MHMNSAPQLLNEDRPEFERVLDEALHTVQNSPEFAAADRRLNPEQLRTMALDAAALINTAAAVEYQRYIDTREATRSAPRPVRLTTAVGEDPERTGPGVAAVAVVLFPVLAGTAAVIFLVVGFVLKMLEPPPDFAGTLLTAGWVFAALAAAGILVAGVCLLLTALRNGSTSLRAGGPKDSDETVARARREWTDALSDHGILPFLRDAQAAPAPDAAPLGGPAATGGDGRMPQLGYHRPGFSSPEGGGTATGRRPSYSSPDFTSPDFGGPEHQPD